MMRLNELELLVRELINQGDGYSSIVSTASDIFGEDEKRVSEVYHSILGVDTSKHNSGEMSMSLYKPEYADKIYKMRVLGKQFSDITAQLRVSNFDLNTWRDKIPEVKEAWEKAENHDYEVVEALLKIAKGHSDPETKVFCAMGEIVTAKVEKVYPPSIKAIETWLKAKHPSIWKDCQYVETRSLDSPKELTDEELDERLKQYGVTTAKSPISSLEPLES